MENIIFVVRNWENKEIGEVFDTEDEALERCWARWFIDCGEEHLGKPENLFRFAVSLNRTFSIGNYYVERKRV